MEMFCNGRDEERKGTSQVSPVHEYWNELLLASDAVDDRCPETSEAVVEATWNGDGPSTKVPAMESVLLWMTMNSQVANAGRSLKQVWDGWV